MNGVHSEDDEHPCVKGQKERQHSDTRVESMHG